MKDLNYQFSSIDFEIAKDIWRQNLWIDRTSKIEENSALTYPELEINMKNMSFPAKFYCSVSVETQKIVAILGGHETVDRQYRLRGLWVHPDHRRNGIARKLISMFETGPASRSKASILWSMPRASAIQLYQACGFQIVNGPFDKFEMGPHFLVSKKLFVEIDHSL